MRRLWNYLRLRGYRRCTYPCGWVWPYGFVPHAGCPVHDSEETR